MQNDLSSFSEAYLDHAALMVIERDTKNATPQIKPSFVLNGGQPGVGKTILNNASMLSFNNNAVIINGDTYRAYHPNIMEIKKSRTNYVSLTKSFAEAINKRVLDHCIKNRFNIVMETTLQNTTLILNTFDYFKRLGYSTQLNILAANRLVSTTGINIRYEKENLNGIGRMTSQEGHDYRYNQIPVTLKAIDTNRASFDLINIYKRDYLYQQSDIINSIVLKATQPTDLAKAYLEIRDEPLTAIEKKYLLGKIDEASRYQVLRGASGKSGRF